MGKTQKPLSILVTDPVMLEWKEIKELKSKLHEVCGDGSVRWDPREFDLVLGPNCWMMDEAHRSYLKVAVEAARKKRYPK